MLFLQKEVISNHFDSGDFLFWFEFILFVIFPNNEQITYFMVVGLGVGLLSAVQWKAETSFTRRNISFFRYTLHRLLTCIHETWSLLVKACHKVSAIGLDDYLANRYNYLRQRGCFHLSLSVCLYINRITQKQPIKYWLKFIEWLDIMQESID